MDISLVVRYFTIGGLERVVSSLANGFVARDHNVKIIVLSKGKRNSLITELDTRVKVVFLEGNIGQKIKALREETKESLVNIHFGDGKIHPIIRLGLLGRTTVVTCHSVYSHKRNIFLNLADRIFSIQAKKKIAVSDAVKDFCVNEVHDPKEKIMVIRNGIEKNKNVVKKERGKVLKIISLASLYPHKNHDYLIRALSDLKNKCGIPFKLYVIGDGPCLSDLFLKAKDLGIKDDIVWYGAVWHKDLVMNIVKSSDVFVSASKYEGFPISILEGMSFGLPMILSDIPPHREICGSGAMYFSLDDGYKSFENVISKFYYDNDIARSMSDYSFDRVGKYSLDKMVDNYISTYCAVVE